MGITSSSAFFIVFALTIILTRSFLYLKPIASPTILGIRMHHYMLGTFLMLIAFVAGSMILFAIGLGLFVDEAMFLLMGGKNHEDNYSARSLLGTVLFVLLVFLLRHYLVMFFGYFSSLGWLEW